MTIYDELKARGLIAQVTDEEEIKEVINNGKATFYIGFDCTADSLTAGHFMALTLMKRLQMAGNKPIALIGGGTTMIGDPSGRTDMRKMLTKEDIDHNAECFKRQMERFIEFGEGKAMMLNNADWLLNLNYIELLREVGPCFSVNNMLRAVKNRYGSTNEIGMFDMTGKGLEQIENPSQVMLEGRPIGISGTCVACVMEGTRPVLSEIQALVTKTAFPSPRRTASGFDYNRMYLLLAVLEKRAGYVFGNQDVYINIIGGLKLDETACDLPVCLAMASSLLDLPVPEKTLAIGEVGLGGEVRSVPHLETRLREAQRVGFDTAIVPKHNLNMLDAAQFPGLRLVGVAYLREAINAIKINK